MIFMMALSKPYTQDGLFATPHLPLLVMLVHKELRIYDSPFIFQHLYFNFLYIELSIIMLDATHRVLNL